PPPISGSYPYYNTYGSFGPDQSGFPQKGASYVDPIFGSTIKRLTNDFGSLSFSENYAKNGFWNSDSTLYHHNTIAQGGVILDTNTGAVVRSGVPGNYDGSFAPENPDIWYYFSGSQLREYFVSTGANSLVKDFGAPLSSLGGSVDWIDASGRYMVLVINGQIQVYDKQADVLFSGSIPYSLGGGYVAISPNAKYVI